MRYKTHSGLSHRWRTQDAVHSTHQTGPRAHLCVKRKDKNLDKSQFEPCLSMHLVLLD